jgi:ribosome-associated translation inhibitor RaiA
MVASATKGIIVLENFKLDEDEMLVAKKIVDKCADKIGRYVEYEELKLEMKVRQKERNQHFIIKGRVIHPHGKVVSEQEDTNPFVAINETLTKMLVEIQHSIGDKK